MIVRAHGLLLTCLLAICFFVQAALRAMAAHCPRLLSLDLGGCRQLVADGSLLNLAHSCPLLRSLNLRFCEHVSEDAIKQVQAVCVNVQVRR